MLSFFFISAAAFWNEPHMAIVRIAEKTITQEQADWLNILFQMWPSEPDTMVSAATWHDDVNYNVAKVMAQWHFSDIPIIHPNFTLENPTITYNVTSVLNDTLEALFDSSTTNVWALHFLFRNLAHFIGDCHTPVHSAAYFSEQYPEGDYGGNRVYFDYDYCDFGTPCDQLHKMWDSGVLNFQSMYIDDPKVLEEFEYNISHIMSMHSPGSLPTIHILDPYEWIQEAHDVAVNYAYGKLVDLHNTSVRYKTVSSDYFVEGQAQAENLIVKAGYRLALIIDKFWNIHHPGDPRIKTSSAMPAREIILWILDSVIILVTIVYAALLIKEKKCSLFANPAFQGSRYEEISGLSDHILRA